MINILRNKNVQKVFKKSEKKKKNGSFAKFVVKGRSLLFIFVMNWESGIPNLNKKKKIKKKIF